MNKKKRAEMTTYAAVSGFDPGQTSFSFNKFSHEAIFEKDNSREANLRIENKSVTSSIVFPI